MMVLVVSPGTDACADSAGERRDAQDEHLVRLCLGISRTTPVFAFPETILSCQALRVIWLAGGTC